MPYNTRRKSLSLTLLGIHVPVSHAERAAAAAVASANRTMLQKEPGGNKLPALSVPCHANKRVKLSHGKASDALLSPTVSSGLSTEDKNDVKYEHTPPPSPERERQLSCHTLRHTSIKTVDLEGTDDDVVEAVILQLQATANRPHLVKELAMVLTQNLPSVQHSANPCAIISSRLSSYLKRPCWTALAPCPLAKQFEPAHPRRTYFHLTTCPHQPLRLSASTQIPHRAAVSPSISSVESQSEDDDVHRREMSPSPEVDLSPPDFDDMTDDVAMPATPTGSLPKTLRIPRSIRSASPPLEKDEREFTQTADGLQKRKLYSEAFPGYGDHIQADDSARDDIFGDRQNIAVGLAPPMSFTTSPAVRATFPPSSTRKDPEDNWLKFGKSLEWDHRPEDIELEELECLLDTC